MPEAVAVAAIGVCAVVVLACWVVVVYFSLPGRHNGALLSLAVASLFVVLELSLVLSGESDRQRVGSVFTTAGVMFSLAIGAAIRSRSTTRR